MKRTLRAIRLLVLCGCPLVNPSLTHADVVLDWNIVTMRTAAAAPFNPPLESRNAAIVHAAMFDAVNSIVREFHHYAVRLRRTRRRIAGSGGRGRCALRARPALSRSARGTRRGIR